MARQAIVQFEPRDMFSVKYVYLGNKILWPVQTTDIDMDFTRVTICFVAQWRAAFCAETTAYAGRGFIHGALPSGENKLRTAKSDKRRHA